MPTGVFYEISLILVIATVISGVIRLLRQPLIIGYILTGLLVGPSVLNLVQSTETFEVFSHIGVALLLFIIGLGLNPRVIKEVGKVSLLTGIGQIAFTTLIGFGITKLLGFSNTVGIYISIALAFSSTIIILKLLSDKKELGRLYGKIATGFLLVQDIVAVLILIAVSGVSGNEAGGNILLELLLKGGALVFTLSLLSVYILPKLSEFFAKSPEFLYLFSIGWGLGVASLSAILGFSIEIGALAAGVALASTPYSIEISSRMRPLRDFFVVLFFIVLGSGLSLEHISPNIVPALALSAFVLVGNPLIVMTIMGMLGYSRKTGFKAGLAVAQISEFSLILIVLAQNVGHVSEDVVGMVTLIGLITIAISSYMIIYSDELYEKIESSLKIFEKSSTKGEQKSVEYEAILFGYKGGSKYFIDTFRKLNKKFLVVDYNPEIIDQLRTKKINCRYGDANDAEFLEELNLDRTRLVIINLTEYDPNKLIVNHVRLHNKKAVVIAMTKSDDVENALELYEDGASYVMMPHYQNALKISSLIKRHGLAVGEFKDLKTKHTHYLLNETN